MKGINVRPKTIKLFGENRKETSAEQCNHRETTE
jgi:hypothetical protein